RHGEGTDRGRGTQPAEPDWSAMQNLIGKNWEQGGGAAEQNRKKIEREGGENHLLAQDKTDSCRQTAPCVPGHPRSQSDFLDRQDEEKKEQGAGGVERVNERKTHTYDQQSPDCRTEHATDLKDAAVPSNGIGEGLARDQSRKERAPGRPAESTDRGRDQHDQINQRQGEIVEVKRRVPLEDSRDQAQQII